MVPIKILVAIISTMLQRFESRTNVKKTYYAAQVQTGECGKRKLAGSGNCTWLKGKIQRRLRI